MEPCWLNGFGGDEVGAGGDVRGCSVLVFVLSLVLVPTKVQADAITFMSYDDIETPPGVIERFERIDVPQTGLLDQLVTLPGVGFGSHFAGQRSTTRVVSEEKFDRVFQIPSNPLGLVLDPVGENLSWEYDNDHGSFVMLGVGPIGTNRKAAVGEGSIAILFNEEVCQVGFIAFVEGSQTYNTGYEGPGSVLVTFYKQDGSLIDTRTVVEKGLARTGFKQEDAGAPMIRGLLLQNMDIEGIMIDDLEFSRFCNQQVS